VINHEIDSFIATSEQQLLSNSTMEEDRALVSGVLKGDMQALRFLIKKHERLVVHMIGRLVISEEEREELCQDVFLKVYDNLSKFSFQSKLSTWIATIAYRHAINHLKKKKMQWKEIPDENNMFKNFIENVNPEIILENDDMDLFILKLTDQLPHHYKSVLMLYHIDGMSYSEIAEVTDMPEGTVKNYIFRARKLLKEIVMRFLGKEELL
jgi:RNA polymerase sigma-70 factor (ECF subfamily)